MAGGVFVSQKAGIRLAKMSLSPWGLNFLHRRNPWAAAWWSVALPGLGHLYCGSYVKGLVLMSWEIAINLQGNLNLSIYHTLLGDTEMAKQVLNMRWTILYPPIYLLSVYDAYRVAVETNKLYDLERLQRSRYFEFHTMTFLGQNMLLRRNPWVAAFWALTLGGAGHFHNMQLLKGLVLMMWHMAIWIESGMSQAVALTLLGRTAEIGQVINYEWLLFWPSIHMFNVWNAWVDCVDQNNLYDEAELHWMRAQVQTTEQKPPLA